MRLFFVICALFSCVLVDCKKMSKQPALPKLPKNSLSVADFATEQHKIYYDLPSNIGDPIESSDKYEGDIDLMGKPIEHYVDKVIDDSPGATKRPDHVLNTAVRASYRLWPKATIPYTISPAFRQRDRAVIASAIARYSNKTCIKWVPLTTENNYVEFIDGTGCYSAIGRHRKRQTISLGHNCVTFGTVLHEMMHTVGFFHEQSRTDRDKYVDIIWDNMLPEGKENFKKLSLHQIDLLGTEYDYDSIMHYGRRFYSKNGKPTIEPKKDVYIGQREDFSKVDIDDLNKLYECKESREDEDDGINKHCEHWAEHGECDRYPAYMQKNCKDYCRKDYSNDPKCPNNHRSCDYWAKNGECKKSKRYMKKNCKGACDKC